MNDSARKINFHFSVKTCAICGQTGIVPPTVNATAILLAAGSSARMSNEIKDKILFPLKGKPAIVYSWRAFIDSGLIDRLVTVFRDDFQRGKLESAFAQWFGHTPGIEIKWTSGGKERQDSVLTGLAAVAAPPPEVVFIHDCARPLVRPGILGELHALAREDGAAALRAGIQQQQQQQRTAGGGGSGGGGGGSGDC